MWASSAPSPMRMASAAKPSRTPATSAGSGESLGPVVGERDAAGGHRVGDLVGNVGGLARLRPDVQWPVVLVDEDNGGGVGARVGVAEHAVAADDDEGAGLDEIGRAAWRGRRGGGGGGRTR